MIAIILRSLVMAIGPRKYVACAQKTYSNRDSGICIYVPAAVHLLLNLS